MNSLKNIFILLLVLIFQTGNLFGSDLNINFSNSAISYLNSLGWKENKVRSNLLNITLINIMSEDGKLLRTTATKKDVAYAIFSLIQVQRTYSKFPISINNNFYASFPEKSLISNFDKNFKNKSQGIIFNKESRNFIFGNNKMCITDTEQNMKLSNLFANFSIIDAPVGIMLDGIENMKAVNMFGETIAVFHKINSDLRSKTKNYQDSFIKYRVQINRKFKNENINMNPIFISFNLTNCQPNELADKIEKLSQCTTCKYFLQINKIFFNVADTIYLFFSKYILSIIAIVLAFRFIYSFGKEHYINLGGNNIDYKSMFFTFIKAKLFKVIIFTSLLWVHPAFIVKWTVEPIMLMGVTLSKEILNASGSVKNKKTCKESELIKNISEDNNERKEKFIKDNNILFTQTEKLIDGNKILDNTGDLKYSKIEQEKILSSYTASILCNIYEVRDFLVKHQIIGEILATFSLRELWLPSTKTTGGIVQSVLKSPVFYITIGIITTPWTGGLGLLAAIFTPLLVDYNRTTTLLNLSFFGIFLYISMILFNFILFLYFIDLCVNLAVIVMKIPLYLIVWIFKDQDIIDLSFSEFFSGVKGNVISIASISFIIALMMTFMEYVYYNFLEIPVGAIDKAFEYGRIDFITNPITNTIATRQSNLDFAFLDIMLMVLTFWYISRNMDKLLGILGGNLPGNAIAKETKDKLKSLYNKVVGVTTTVINLKKQNN